ncbi:hypothetical protein BDV06DRAFT_231918 [Aspergillus oleicola]
MANNSALKIVFGAMTFGKPNTLGARVSDAAKAAEILDVFLQHGHKEVDTARIYGAGSCEEILAVADWEKRGIILDTKLYPNAGGALASAESYTHKPEDVRRGLMNSLKALQTEKIDMFYLHGPDRKTPFEDTLREVNKLHQEGYFIRFGISNYMSWEVAQICELCRKNGWVMPSVYQGIYHALQPGGFLTGRYKRDQTDFETGSRFDPNIMQGSLHRNRYWNDVYFDAIEKIQSAAEEHSLTPGEVALRWLKHHSQLRQELGDAIIVGASSVNHIGDNLDDLEKGPLPEEIVQTIDKAWPFVKGSAPKYWH